METVIVLLFVICLALWLVQIVVLPRLAEPWRTVVIVVLVIALILYLSVRFLGLHL